MSKDDFKVKLAGNASNIDAQAVADMHQSKGWGEFMSFLKAVEGDLYEELFHGSGEPVDNVIRGRIDMIRTMQDFEETILNFAEYEKSLEKDAS